MFRIDNRANMTITRGDSALILLYINQGTYDNLSQYNLRANDKVVLFIMDCKEQDYRKSYVIKEFDINDLCVVETKTGAQLGEYILLQITPEDTKTLLHRDYSYEIKLMTVDGTFVDTIGPRRYFYVED